MCSNYPTPFGGWPIAPTLPPHPDWVNPDGSLKPLPEERSTFPPLAKVVFIEAGEIKTDTVPVHVPEPVDTYHDDMRRFFFGLLVALPIAGVVWGVLVVAIILGIAKAGHN